VNLEPNSKFKPPFFVKLELNPTLALSLKITVTDIMRQNARCLNSGYNTSYYSIKFIFTNNVRFQTVLTCVSEMVMIGIAEEKFYNHAAVFTTSLAKIGELSLWKQKLSASLQYFEKM